MYVFVGGILLFTRDQALLYFSTLNRVFITGPLVNLMQASQSERGLPKHSTVHSLSNLLYIIKQVFNYHNFFRGLLPFRIWRHYWEKEAVICSLTYSFRLFFLDFLGDDVQ